MREHARRERRRGEARETRSPDLPLERVEGVEVGPLPSEHDRVEVEVTETARAEAYDLALEDGVPPADRMTDFLRELRPLLELVALGRR